MTGGGDISVPGPSEEERALQAEQTQLLRQQRDILSKQLREQQLLSPFLFEQAGVKPIIGEDGEITAFERVTDELDPLRRDIEKGFLERTQAALRGELPIDPGLEKDLGDQERILMETLRRQLGPGFETSGPGIEAIARFREQSTNLREAARRGDLTLSEQLGMARELGNEGQIDRSLQRIFGVHGLGNQQVGQFAQGIASAEAPLSRFLQERGLQTQASIASAQAGASSMAGLFQGLGSLGGSLGGAAVLKYSDRRLKTDIERVGTLENGIPVYTFRYRNDPKKRIGVMADEVVKVLPHAIRFDDAGYALVDYGAI